MLYKKCEKCGFSPCHKNGSRNGLQRYKCKSCGYVRENKRRSRRYDELYEEYTIGKQTYDQLARKYDVHKSTIKRHIELAKANKKK